MTALADSIDLLAGCPCEEDVRWIVEQMAEGSPRCETTDLQRHVDVASESAAELSMRLHQWASGLPAITRIEGFSVDPSGDTRIEYTAAGGRIARLVLGRSPDGRICSARVERLSADLEGIDIVAFPTPRLEPEHRRDVHDVFDAAYRNADHEYLDDQLSRLDMVGLARRDEQLIGFLVVGRRTLDLPILGSTRVNFGGLACTRPEIRRGGVMYSLASAALTRLEAPANVLATSRLATPATLKAQAALVPMAKWPAEENRLALYESRTATRQIVGAALAEAQGAHDFDDEHFVCIGPGRAIGEPVIEIDVEPEYWTPFRPVDRSRGDTLLWITWRSDPPTSWF